MGRELINQSFSDTNDHYSSWFLADSRNDSTFFIDNKQDQEVEVTIEGARREDVNFYSKDFADDTDGMGSIEIGSGVISAEDKGYETLRDRFDALRVKIKFSAVPSGNKDLKIQIMGD